MSLSVAFMLFRAWVLPEAPPLQFNIVGMAVHSVLMFLLLGQRSFDWESRLLIQGWYIAIIITFTAYIALKPKPLSQSPALWLLCAVLASTTGLTMVRINLLMFPITFVALFICSTLADLARRSRLAKVVAMAVLIWGIGGGAYLSLVTAESFHPFSATAIRWDSDFIYGDFASRASIPASRREQIIRQLAAVNITSATDIREHLSGMIMQALIENRRSPRPDRSLFVPRLIAIYDP